MSSSTSFVLHSSWRKTLRVLGTPEMMATVTRAEHLAKRGRTGAARGLLRKAAYRVLSAPPASMLYSVREPLEGRSLAYSCAEALCGAPEKADAMGLIGVLRKYGLLQEADFLSAHSFHSPVRWYWGAKGESLLSNDGFVNERFLARLPQNLRLIVAQIGKFYVHPLAGTTPVLGRYNSYAGSVHLSFMANGASVHETTKVAPEGAISASTVRAAIRSLLTRTLPVFSAATQEARQTQPRLRQLVESMEQIVSLFPFADPSHFAGQFAVTFSIGIGLAQNSDHEGTLPRVRTALNLSQMSNLEFAKEIARLRGEQHLHLQVV